MTKLFLSLLAAFISVGAWAQEIRCGGGGPEPFVDLPDLHPKLAPLPTAGPLSEFVGWDAGQSIIYRTQSGSMFQQILGQSSYRYIGGSYHPLAPIIHPTEGYLSTESNWVLADGYWMSYTTAAIHPRHLFWDRNFLYSLDNVRGPSGIQELRVFRYRKGLGFARMMCRFPSGLKEELKIAEGAEFPFVPLYSTRSVPGGHELSVYQMNVETCDVVIRGTYKDPFMGAVQAVHRFPALNAYAVKVDHPSENLMWDYGTGCTFFDVGPRDVYVPSHSRPVVATWDEQSGLTLMNLERKSRGVFVSGGNLAAPRQRDLWLPFRGHDLYVATSVGTSTRKGLYRIDIQDIFK